MSRGSVVNSDQRFVLYVPNALLKEIEDWVNKMGITFAEFGREAFELYLSHKGLFLQRYVNDHMASR